MRNEAENAIINPELSIRPKISSSPSRRIRNLRLHCPSKKRDIRRLPETAGRQSGRSRKWGRLFYWMPRIWDQGYTPIMGQSIDRLKNMMGNRFLNQQQNGSKIAVKSKGFTDWPVNPLLLAPQKGRCRASMISWCCFINIYRECLSAFYMQHSGLFL